MEGNVIAELGLQAWPEDKRLKLLEDLTDLAQKRAFIRIVDALDGSDAQEAERLSDDPDVLLAFLATKGDLATAIVEETERLKAELLAEASEEAPIPEA